MSETSERARRGARRAHPSRARAFDCVYFFPFVRPGVSRRRPRRRARDRSRSPLGNGSRTLALSRWRLSVIIQPSIGSVRFGRSLAYLVGGGADDGGRLLALDGDLLGDSLTGEGRSGRGDGHCSFLKRAYASEATPPASLASSSFLHSGGCPG